MALFLYYMKIVMVIDPDQEVRLARDYRYQLSETVKEVLKIASAAKALNN